MRNVISYPKDATILSSTWAMKKKASGTFRARLNACGCEQIDGKHYNKNTKAAPVGSKATICIVLVGWEGHPTEQVFYFATTATTTSTTVGRNIRHFSWNFEAFW